VPFLDALGETVDIKVTQARVLLSVDADGAVQQEIADDLHVRRHKPRHARRQRKADTCATNIKQDTNEGEGRAARACARSIAMVAGAGTCLDKAACVASGNLGNNKVTMV
jgi:hypothetical protein